MTRGWHRTSRNRPKTTLHKHGTNVLVLHTCVSRIMYKQYYHSAYYPPGEQTIEDAVLQAVVALV